MATERRVSWIISANVKQWQKGLNKAQRRMDRFGRKMQRTGRSLTQNVTMPLGAAAGASIKMASDFQSSLSQAQAQAAMTAKEVTFVGDAAKRTAIRTGESTDDIIEAYKFTISAGQNLSESQETVTAAAEAAAAGFGEQRDLVRLATTALQAYGDQLDGSRQFMDLLVGSAQAMELEVSKLGPAVQRNVGVAKELGISLEQLMAGIGSVSEIMGDAQRGGRMFQTMLSKILSPSAEASGSITKLFGSLENFHRSIREEGLLQTMVELRKRLEDAGMGFEDVFTGQRGLEAALNFTNREGERTNEILQSTTDTAGNLKDAFDAVSDSTERNFRQALRALQVTAIELGEIMLPMVNKVIDAVKEFATSFSQLSEGVKVNALKIAGLLGAGGPILTAVGFMISTLASISWPVVLGVAAAGAAIRKIMANWDTIVAYFSSGDGMKIWDTIKSAAHTTYDTLQSVFDSMEGLFRSASNFLIRVWEVFGSEIKLITKSSLKLVKGALETGLDALALALDVFSARWATDWDGFWADNEERVKRFGENIVDIFLGTSKEAENAFGKLVIDTENMTLSWKTMSEEASKTASDLDNTYGIMRAGNSVTESATGYIKSLATGYGVLAFNAKQASQATKEANQSASQSGGGSGGGGGQVFTTDVGRATGNISMLNNTLNKVASGGLQKASGAMDSVQEAMKVTSEEAKVMGQALQQAATGAITSFAETLGNAFTGDAGASGFFNNLLMIVVDFANQFGKLLIAAGVAAQAFKSLLANPFAAIAAGVALVAATTAVKNLLRDGPEQESGGQETSVNDALIRSDGSIVNFHPNDDILASKNLGGVISGMGGGQVINNQLNLDGRVVWENQRRVNTNKRR